MQRLPDSICNKVEEELAQLQSPGIITLVQFADWAAPIVPVLKADKYTVIICGDFMMTVNQASRLGKYPIPKLRTCSPRCQEEPSSPNLICRQQVYQQIQLDEESKKYVVINTHRAYFNIIGSHLECHQHLEFSRE